MHILVLETATRRGSLALWTDGVVHARPGGDRRTHGARLPGEILTLLADHGCSLADVDLFGVVAGPGSFTGLRVGMACIQGLALAGARQVIPIPTLEVMAESWRTGHLGTERPRIHTPEPQNPRTAAHTLVIACLDGQRGDVFFAGWDMTESPVEEASEVIASSVGKPEDLKRRLAVLLADESGLGARPVLLIGDGARRHAEVFAGLGAEVCDLEDPLASTAARMAARRRALAVAPHALRPLYIRRPDAELARERAGLSWSN